MKAQWRCYDPVNIIDPVDVTNCGVLDTLLDGLHDAGMAWGRPVAVSLYHTLPGPILIITVGDELAAAEWWPLPHSPPVASLAPPGLRPGDDNDMTIDISGQLSTVPARRLFPAERARAGARTFFVTGERPAEIPWQPAQQPKSRVS